MIVIIFCSNIVFKKYFLFLFHLSPLGIISVHKAKGKWKQTAYVMSTLQLSHVLVALHVSIESEKDYLVYFLFIHNK